MSTLNFILTPLEAKYYEAILPASKGLSINNLLDLVTIFIFLFGKFYTNWEAVSMAITPDPSTVIWLQS
jgi:hypothetical protein